MSTPGPSSSRQVLSLERGLRCLAALGRRNGEASFTVLQQASGDLPDPTMARLLRSLKAAGLIESLGRGAGYRLTDLARSMAMSILQQDDLATLCRPACHKLAHATGLSTAVFIPHAEGIKMLVKTEVAESVHLMSEGGIRDQIGGHAAAQIFAAYDDECRKRYRTGLRRDLNLPGSTFRDRLDDIRLRGLHVGHGEEIHGPPGRRQRNRLHLRIAAPLRAGEEGPLLAALTLTTQTDQRNRVASPQLLRLVKRSSEQLSEELANLPTLDPVD